MLNGQLANAVAQGQTGEKAAIQLCSTFGTTVAAESAAWIDPEGEPNRLQREEWIGSPGTQRAGTSS